MGSFLDLMGMLKPAKPNPPPLGARVPSTGNGYRGSKVKVTVDKPEKHGKGKHRG